MSLFIPVNISAFLANASPEELQAITSAIANRQSQQQRRSTPASLNQVVSNARVTKSKKDSSSGKMNKAKRPLNSWMAFRSYYNHIFSGQQKEISPLLNQLWQVELFRGKWTLLAKAYSVIRDQVGKDAAPLSGFLQIACPLVGIISPEKYLFALGWKLQYGRLQRETLPKHENFSVDILHTSLSVTDLVTACADNGFFTPTEDFDFTINNLAMATIPHQTRTSTPASIDQQTSSPMTTYSSADDVESDTDGCGPVIPVVNSAPPYAVNSHNWIGLGPRLKPMYMNAGLQIAHAEQTLAASGEDYPFPSQWIPNNEQSDIMIQPGLGDQFDAVDYNAEVPEGTYDDQPEILHNRPEGAMVLDMFADDAFNFQLPQIDPNELLAQLDADDELPEIDNNDNNELPEVDDDDDGSEIDANENTNAHNGQAVATFQAEDGQNPFDAPILDFANNFELVVEDGILQWDELFFGANDGDQN